MGYLYLIAFFCITFINGHTAFAIEDDMDVDSRGNIKITVGDKEFQFNIAGRLQWDYDHFQGVYNAGKTGSDTELRRGRITVGGTVERKWKYKLQYDFDVDGASDLKDAYILYDGSIGVKIGKYKLPFSLEELISSKHIPSIERSEILGWLRISRYNLNIQVEQYQQAYTWTAGLYQGHRDNNGAIKYDIGGRFTFLPFYEKTHWLHLGIAALSGDSGDGAVRSRYRTRLGVHTIGTHAGTRHEIFDTEDLAGNYASEYNQIGLEFAYLYGPFSLQMEWMQGTNDMAGLEGTSNTMSADVSGNYVLLTYTLTGESRTYKKGTPDKIADAHNTWELILKVENGELKHTAQQATIFATAQSYSITTLGVNWYINKNMRFSANLLNASTDNFNLPSQVEQDGSALSMRIQYAF